MCQIKGNTGKEHLVVVIFQLAKKFDPVQSMNLFSDIHNYISHEADSNQIAVFRNNRKYFFLLTKLEIIHQKSVFVAGGLKKYKMLSFRAKYFRFCIFTFGNIFLLHIA